MKSETVDDVRWRVVTAVANERGIDPRRLSDRLQDVVDAEALARLVDQAWSSDSIDLSVSFRIAGCFVTITGDETVRVTVPE